jgi:hypothetical protein
VIWYVALVVREMVAVQMHEAIIAVHLSILDKTLGGDAMFKIGQNQVNTLTDMTMYSRTNAQMLTVGNSMTTQVHINVWMLITQ